MTNKEVIEVLKEEWRINAELFGKQFDEALDLAIKALENERPVGEGYLDIKNRIGNILDCNLSVIDEKYRNMILDSIMTTLRDSGLRDGQEFYSNGYKKGYEDGKKENAIKRDVWELYQRHQSHLGTYVYEFGVELNALLKRYDKNDRVDEPIDSLFKEVENEDNKM